MKIDVVTPFPEMLRGFLQESMLKRAQDKGVVAVTLWDLREYTTDKHQTVDDYPFGGGPGMILKPEPFFRAMDDILKTEADRSCKIIFMTPQGKPFTQDRAVELTREDHLVFLCGHYRGVDQRVIKTYVTDEISIGDYILTGGELAASVVIDAVVRLLPGVLGDFNSAEGDSFYSGHLDHPHYTRPAEFRGMKVPEVLLSGHHAKIESWQKEQSERRTRERRPDLFEKKSKS
jgi:tRNA (guanine37-N1)-methyltransferase